MTPLINAEYLYSEPMVLSILTKIYSKFKKFGHFWNLCETGRLKEATENKMLGMMLIITKNLYATNRHLVLDYATSQQTVLNNTYKVSFLPGSRINDNDFIGWFNFVKKFEAHAITTHFLHFLWWSL